MREVDATFEAWGELDPAQSPTATVRGSLVGKTHQNSASLPHLSIHDQQPGELAPASAQLVVEELLGEGGMGQVHRARQPMLDRDVAIKRLRPGLPSTARAALLREARYMGSLEHPNIIPVHALGEDEGAPVLVMKRVEGWQWLDVLGDAEHEAWQGHAGTETDLLGRNVEVLLEVCRAVAFAHERGIAHRDLKPDNVLVGKHGGVYVFDWGIAARLDGPPSQSVAGTPAYLPPEMSVPGSRPDVRQDVYLLGGCLFHVLAGRAPHPGEGLQAVLAAAMEGELAPLPEQAPRALAELCLQALAVDPGERPKDATTMAQGLSLWLRRRTQERTLERCEALVRQLVDADPVQSEYRKLSDAFAGARFGYEQVLAESPGERVAEEGLCTALSAMALVEVARGNVEQARRWRDELAARGREDSSLSQSIDRLDATQRRRAQLADEMDLEVGESARVVAVVGMIMIGAMITAFAVFGQAGREGGFDHGMTLGFGMLMLVLVSAVGVLRYRDVTANVANRGLYSSVMLITVGVVGHRVLALYEQWPMREVFLMDMLVMGVGSVVLGLFTRPWILLFGWFCLACILPMVAWPGRPEVAFGVFSVLAFVASLGARQLIPGMRGDRL